MTGCVTVFRTSVAELTTSQMSRLAPTRDNLLAMRALGTRQLGILRQQLRFTGTFNSSI